MTELTFNLYASSMHNHQKTPLVALTQGVTQITIQQPGFLHPNGTCPMVLRRHFSVTLPLRWTTPPKCQLYLEAFILSRAKSAALVGLPVSQFLNR